MEITMLSGVTNGMFLLNNYSTTKAVSQKQFKKEVQLQAMGEDPMIESIIETIVEPIIFKC